MKHDQVEAVLQAIAVMTALFDGSDEGNWPLVRGIIGSYIEDPNDRGEKLAVGLIALSMVLVQHASLSGAYAGLSSPTKEHKVLENLAKVFNEMDEGVL